MTKHYSFLVPLGGWGDTAEEAWGACVDAVNDDGIGEPMRSYLADWESGDEVDFATLAVRLGVAQRTAGSGGHWTIFRCEVEIPAPFVPDIVEEAAQQEYAKQFPNVDNVHRFWLEGYETLSTKTVVIKENEEEQDAGKSEN